MAQHTKILFDGSIKSLFFLILIWFFNNIWIKHFHRMYCKIRLTSPKLTQVLCAVNSFFFCMGVTVASLAWHVNINFPIDLN